MIGWAFGKDDHPCCVAWLCLVLLVSFTAILVDAADVLDDHHERCHGDECDNGKNQIVVVRSPGLGRGHGGCHRLSGEVEARRLDHPSKNVDDSA